MGKGEKERGKESARERGAEGRLGAAEGENGVGTGGRGGKGSEVGSTVIVHFFAADLCRCMMVVLIVLLLA